MKVQCPHCKAKTNVPKLYVNTEINCTQCKKSFTAVAYLPVEIRMAAIESAPYLLLCSLLGYPFVIWEYAPPYLVAIKYAIVISALTGIMILVCRPIRRKWPLLRKPAVICFSLLSIFLLYSYALRDRRMEYRIIDNIAIYDTYTRWGHNLIYRSMNNLFTRESPDDLGFSMRGPMASRPGSYYPQQHGCWEKHYFTSPPTETRYEWYWYGEEITEGQWLQRTER